MPWPSSQDYNEAVQSPLQTFGDPELREGIAVTNAIGLPRPRSGNFADVYEFRCPKTGNRWAVKCFTRQVRGLRERYQSISDYLVQANLPFIVPFQFLEKGIRIRGDCFPILKMQWVEGPTLNTFVREYLDKPATLEALAQLWARMSRRLREARIAHADLQHGNVLLVPGSKAESLAVKLIDYDGVCVPPLLQSPSGEVGHPAYQHPQRSRDRKYNLEVDRFPSLVIVTALRSLMAAGAPLWNKYDNGDNLLFRESDFLNPEASPLFAELRQVKEPAARRLIEQLRGACRLPLESCPLVETLLPQDPSNPGSQPRVPAVAVRQQVSSSPPISLGAAKTVLQAMRPPQAIPVLQSSKKRSKAVLAVVGGLCACGLLMLGGVALLILLRLNTGDSLNVRVDSDIPLKVGKHSNSTKNDPDKKGDLGEKADTGEKADAEKNVDADKKTDVEKKADTDKQPTEKRDPTTVEEPLLKDDKKSIKPLEPAKAGEIPIKLEDLIAGEIRRKTDLAKVAKANNALALTEIEKKQANERQALIGKKVDGEATVLQVTLVRPGNGVCVTLERANSAGGLIQTTRITAYVAEPNAPSLAKLVSGQEVRVQGTIQSLPQTTVQGTVKSLPKSKVQGAVKSLPPFVLQDCTISANAIDQNAKQSEADIKPDAAKQVEAKKKSPVNSNPGTTKRPLPEMDEKSKLPSEPAKLHEIAIKLDDLIEREAGRRADFQKALNENNGLATMELEKKQAKERQALLGKKIEGEATVFQVTVIPTPEGTPGAGVQIELFRERVPGRNREFITANAADPKDPNLANLKNGQQVKFRGTIKTIEMFGRIEIQDWTLNLNAPAQEQKQDAKEFKGDKVEGKLTAEDPKDKKTQVACNVHKLTMEKGATYVIKMHSQDVDPYLRLEDQNGNQVAEDDDGDGYPNAKIVFRCEADGEYRVICTCFPQPMAPFKTTGKYTLTIKPAAPQETPPEEMHVKVAVELVGVCCVDGQQQKQIRREKVMVVPIDDQAACAGFGRYGGQASSSLKTKMPHEPGVCARPVTAASSPVQGQGKELGFPCSSLLQRV